MRNKIIVLVNVLVMCFLSCVHALQVKSAKDNETLFFKVSEKEYSRLFVTSDRIVSVKGKNNSYEIKEFKGEQDTGVVYIRPIPYTRKSFSIFIATEQGHHFTLLLAPLGIPSENIEIRPVSASKTIAKKWEANLPYTQSLMALMKDMAKDLQPEGYAVIHLGKSQSKKMQEGFSMQLMTIYRGGFLQGESWKLKNESRRQLHLHPRQFYQGNVRALSLINETLSQGDETILYRIVSHE